jgi:hypothetical protein
MHGQQCRAKRLLEGDTGARSRRVALPAGRVPRSPADHPLAGSASLYQLKKPTDLVPVVGTGRAGWLGDTPRKQDVICRHHRGMQPGS